ncbi:MAG: hypothetical protein J6Y16_00430, partial [Treponema sp.]|nr:hypothetical protein [Treponema sp.]
MSVEEAASAESSAFDESAPSVSGEVAFSESALAEFWKLASQSGICSSRISSSKGRGGGSSSFAVSVPFFSFEVVLDF